MLAVTLFEYEPQTHMEGLPLLSPPSGGVLLSVFLLTPKSSSISASQTAVHSWVTWGRLLPGMAWDGLGICLPEQALLQIRVL